MRRLHVLTAAIVTVAFMLGAGSAVAQSKPFDLNTCWMPSHETFTAWYAIKKGWDVEQGFNLKMHYFESGMAEMEALPAKQWVLGGTGSVPMTVGALRYNAYMIGIANDESIINTVMVRPDSPILKVKGHNKSFPEVYGSPETVKGKTILTTTVSSAHFALSTWLKTLGLSDKDVIIKNMDQPQAMAAFEAGVGDVVVLWAPFIFTGAEKGWKKAADLKDCGAAIQLVLVGDKEFCDKNPEKVVKFLKMYFKGIDLKLKEGEKLLPDYKKFYKEWAGMDMSDKAAREDFITHPVYSLDEQLKLFDSSKGPSQVQQWQDNILNFFTDQGRFTPAERDKVLKTPYITDKFLKMLKAEQK